MILIFIFFSFLFFHLKFDKRGVGQKVVRMSYLILDKGEKLVLKGLDRVECLNEEEGRGVCVKREPEKGICKGKKN